MRRLSLALMALTLTTACLNKGSGNYLGGDLACEYNAFTWLNDLATYTDVGSESDGVYSFSWSPGSLAVDSVSGTFDAAETGDFSYAYEYSDEHFNRSYEAVGFGTLFEDGDMDILLDWTREDILGDVTAMRTRHTRSGCEGSLRTNDPTTTRDEPTVTTYTILSDSEVEFVTAYDNDDGVYNDSYVVDSEQNLLGSTEWVDEDDTEYSAEYTADAQERVTDWSQASGDYVYEGSTTSDRVTGARMGSYEMFDNGRAQYTWSFDRDYSGEGTGAYDAADGSLSCDIYFGDNGSCEFENCSDRRYDGYDCG